MDITTIGIIVSIITGVVVMVITLMEFYKKYKKPHVQTKKTPDIKGKTKTRDSTSINDRKTDLHIEKDISTEKGLQYTHDSLREKPEYNAYLKSLRSVLNKDVQSYVSLFAVEKTRTPDGDFSDLLRITASTMGDYEFGRGSDEGDLDELVLASVDRGLNAVIVGEPGTGKSFGLRYITARLADEYMSGQRVPIPIIVPLRGLRLGSNPLNTIRQHILQALSENPLVSPYSIDDFDQLNYALSYGVHIVFFDGINEVYHGDVPNLLAATHRAAKALGKFAATYPDTRFVFTSRNIVQDGLLELKATAAFHLQRLNIKKAIDYLRKSWEHLHPNSTKALISYLMNEGDENLRLFLENPLALSLLESVVAETGVLPKNEHALYSKYVLQRTRRDIERGLVGQSIIHKSFNGANLNLVNRKLVKKLSCVATIMQRIGVGGPIKEIQQSLANMDFEGESPENIIEELIGMEWLIRSYTDGTIRFQHQMFQEFFAAEEILPALRRNSSKIEGLFNKREWHHVISLAASALSQKKAEHLVSQLTANRKKERILLAGRIAALSELSSQTRFELIKTLMLLLVKAKKPDDALEQEVLSLIQRVPGLEGINMLLKDLEDKSNFPVTVIDKILVILGEMLIRAKFASQHELVSYLHSTLQACLKILPEFWGPFIGRVNDLVASVLTTDAVRCEAMGRAYLNSLEAALDSNDNAQVAKLIYIGHVGAAAGDELVGLLNRVISGPFPRQAKAYATKRYSSLYWRKDNFERWRKICLNNDLDPNIRARNAIDGPNYRFINTQDMLNIVELEGFNLHPFVLYYLVYGMERWSWRGNRKIIAAANARVAIKCFKRSNFDAAHIGLRACRNLIITQLGNLLDSQMVDNLVLASSESVSYYTERTINALRIKLGIDEFGIDELNFRNKNQKLSIPQKQVSSSPSEIAKALKSDDILLRRDAAFAISRFRLTKHPELWTACLADYESWVLEAAVESFSQQPPEEIRTYLHKIEEERSAPLPSHTPYVPITRPEQLLPRIGSTLLERGGAPTRYLLPLLESSVESTDPHTRAIAIHGLSYLVKTVEGTKHTVHIFLNDPEPTVRINAINTLFRFSISETLPLLLKVVHGNRRDDSRIVRGGAAKLLGEIEFPASDNICATLLEVINNDRDYGVKCVAIKAFGNCAPIEKLDELKNIFNDPTPGNRGSIGQWARMVHEWAIGSDTQ